MYAASNLSALDVLLEAIYRIAMSLFTAELKEL